jgi:hypothetical protein
MPRSAASASTSAKAALELSGGAAQRGFRLDIELACELGGGEQQVANLVFDRFVSRAPSEFGLDLADFLGDLCRSRRGIRPIEADPRRASADLRRAQQGRKGEGDTVEHAVAPPLTRCRSAALCASQASFCAATLAIFASPKTCG